jgi:hypothetical protein
MQTFQQFWAGIKQGLVISLSPMGGMKTSFYSGIYEANWSLLLVGWGWWIERESNPMGSEVTARASCRTATREYFICLDSEPPGDQLFPGWDYSAKCQARYLLHRGSLQAHDLNTR